MVLVRVHNTTEKRGYGNAKLFILVKFHKHPCSFGLFLGSSIFLKTWSLVKVIFHQMSKTFWIWKSDFSREELMEDLPILLILTTVPDEGKQPNA